MTKQPINKYEIDFLNLLKNTRLALYDWDRREIRVLDDNGITKFMDASRLLEIAEIHLDTDEDVVQGLKRLGVYVEVIDKSDPPLRGRR